MMSSSKVTRGRVKASPSKAKAPKAPKSKAAKKGMKAAPKPSITEIIGTDPHLTITFSALKRVSGFHIDLSLIFDDIHRSLLFQQGNPFRTNNLLNLLNEPGEYTFFAPTNNGLRRLPTSLLRLLFLYDDFLPHFEDLLLYHGFEGRRLISEFGNPDSLTTFNLEQVFTRTDGILRVNGIAVVNPDNVASNGIAHTISGVLAPAWVFNSLLDRTNDSVNLSILLELLVLSGLDSELGAGLDQINAPSSQGTQGLTFLAPTNDAFSDLDSPTDLPFLRDPTNQAELERILRYHIVGGVFPSPLLMNVSTLSSGSGDIAVSVVNQIIMFNQASATSETILANNGALYEINAVLNPDSMGGF
jgi:uncharacterized surface protein with fasciclin (FAS1) repeats